MRIAVIGPGNFAERAALPAIQATPGIELVAIQGRTRARAEEAAERWGAATVCDTVEDVCARRDIDAVFVITPPGPHSILLRQLIEAGKPLIVDKPVTLSSAELAPLVCLADERGLPNAVDHEFRYEPAMLKIAELVRSGALGRIHNSVYDLVNTFGYEPALASQRYWSFHHSAAQGGGILPQIASHHIDLHRSCFGGLEAWGGYCGILETERPEAPAAPGAPDGPMKAVETEDCAALSARLPSGGSAVLSFTHRATSMPDLRWLIHGSEGSLAYDGKDGWYGGRLTLSAGWMGEPREVPVPERTRRSTLGGINGWMADLIGELLLDFAARLASPQGAPGGSHRFATLADELAVWELMERWRHQSRMAGQA